MLTGNQEIQEMNNKQPLSLHEFASLAIVYMLIVMILVRRSVFRPITDISLENSKRLLWLMVILSLTVGCLITYKNKGNNYLALAMMAILPYEMYIAVTYLNAIKTFLYISLLFALICGGAITFRILLRPIKGRKKTKIISNRIKRGMAFTALISTLCLSLVVVPLIINILMGNLIVQSRTESLPSSKVDCDYIENNLNELKKLKPEKWGEISIGEKMKVLSIVANIESSKLGLPHELNLKVSNLDKYIISQYQRGTHTIALNFDYIEESTGLYMVDAVAHEAFHALQHCACEAYSEIDTKNLSIFNSKEIDEIKV